MKHIKQAIIFILMLSFLTPSIAKADDFLNLEAESAILVEAETGKILYQKNPDLMLPPASMTKMMTEYLVLEAISAGKLSWDQTTSVSDYVYKISQDYQLSNVPLRKDGQYTVEELYEAMAIYSANGATIALTELLAGSETNFVKLMNEKAKELKLPDYKFVNSTGLNNSDLKGLHPSGTGQNEENMLSARSTAILAYHLLKDYPEVLKTASIPKKVFREGTEMANWNFMLPSLVYEYEGVDGIKTGSTDLAKYCFTGTAVRNDMRLISVVMKTPSRKARFAETKKLYDYAFNNFTKKQLYPSGFQIEGSSELKVIKGKEKQVGIRTNKPLNVVLKIGEEELYTPVYYLNKDLLTEELELTAPVENIMSVGYMSVKYTGEQKYGFLTEKGSDFEKVDVVTVHSVEKASWLTLTLRSVSDFFSGMWNNISDTFKESLS
jgi:serine-type D-Ala-D-Ala carboxypeptidase (penicillin-binding protein 5/6)